jgi:hypothetical protein
MAGMREATTVMDAKWLGACKPGQKPDDVSVPGLPNINKDELMKEDAQESVTPDEVSPYIRLTSGEI